jgi:1-acyl-sn-glycerol-3-phosphate acyltransferase
VIRFFLSLHARLAPRRGLRAALLAFLAGFFVISLFRLEYKEDVAEFFPDNADNERINAFYRHIGSSNKLFVFFSMADSTLRDKDLITEAIDAFDLRLGRLDSTHMIREAQVRTDDSRALDLANFIRENAPYFLTESHYYRIDSLLAAGDSLHVQRQIREARQLLMLPSGAIMRDMLADDPLMLFAPLLAELQTFQAGDGAEIYNGYLFMGHGRKGVVQLSTPFGASESKQNTALLRMIEEAMADVRADFPGMRVTCFGTPAIAVSNASQIKADSLMSSGLALLLIFALLWYCFRRMRNIVLVFIPVLFGWLFAMAMLSLFVSSVSVIVIGISSIVIGIAVNYPLHFIDHLRHERNIRQVLKDITPPLLIGNITTVGAFASLVFINSNAMRNLGLFASLLLVGAIAFVLVFLPHLVKIKADGEQADAPFLSRLSAFSPERKPWVVLTVAALTCVFGWFSRYTSFEADANKINYLTATQQEDMQDTYAAIEREGSDIVYLLAEGADLDAALRVREANLMLLDSLRRAHLVGDIAGIGPFLASQSEQAERIRRWNGFWQPRRDRLLRLIEQAAEAEGFRSSSFASFSELLHKDFAPQPADAFAPVIDLLAGNYLLEDRGVNMVVTLLYCPSDGSAPLVEALQRASAGSFAFDSRNVLERMVDSLSGDFNYVLYVSGLIVFVFLLMSFGRAELSLLAFLPLTVSWIWILGIMQIGGMSFNIVNIILATFIFGQGDDYTIFITEGLIYEYTYRRRMLAAYKNSIVLSALIMFAGIGMLIFARHPALRSLAEVTMVGMFSVVLMAYLIPPLLFRALTQHRGQYREVPVTLRRLLISLAAFGFFLIFTAWITLCGMVLMRLCGGGERNRLRYHTILSRLSGFVISRIPGVRFRLENLSGESFDKPGVIVANHQSHLDLVCLLMLTPRLVVITNERVWHNPFYGRLIRFADFYPASKGIDAMPELLADRVRHGYSVLVFPEGTRSDDCSILRFHQGAFYLADKLGLDIIPIVLHGAGQVLPKTDFMLRPNGSISVQIHPRISALGRSARQWAKDTRHYYLERYAALARRIETAAYFAPFVLHHYIYKGVAIEGGVRRELRRHKAYSAVIDSWKPAPGAMALVVNGGTGAFAFLLALVHRDANVVSVDADKANTDIARNCQGLPPNLSFRTADDTEADRAFDAVFLLNPSEQQRQARKGACIITA